MSDADRVVEAMLKAESPTAGSAAPQDRMRRVLRAALEAAGVHEGGVTFIYNTPQEHLEGAWAHRLLAAAYPEDQP